MSMNKTCAISSCRSDLVSADMARDDVQLSADIISTQSQSVETKTTCRSPVLIHVHRSGARVAVLPLETQLRNKTEQPQNEEAGQPIRVAAVEKLFEEIFVRHRRGTRLFTG
jgi:hypothetical protein